MPPKKTHENETLARASLDRPPESADTNASADSARHTVVAVRSEGQRLLLAVKGSLADIARAVGCNSRQNVGDWRNGVKVPGPVFRAALLSAYAIPVESWACAPKPVDSDGGAPLPSYARPPSTEQTAAPSTMEDVEALLAGIRRQLNDPDVKLLPGERVKLDDSMVRALGLKHRLEKEAELVEDRIVREHPAWQRIVRVMTKTLVAFPDAARAVAEALAKLEVEP